MGNADSFDRQRSSAIGHQSMTLCNPLGQTTVDELLDGVPWRRGMRVLDLGCGKGAWLAAIAARGDFTLVGVDRNARFLEHARAAVPGAQWIEGDYESVLTRPGRWDLVLCAGSGRTLRGPAPLLERRRRAEYATGCARLRPSSAFA